MFSNEVFQRPNKIDSSDHLFGGWFNGLKILLNAIWQKRKHQESAPIFSTTMTSLPEVSTSSRSAQQQTLPGSSSWHLYSMWCQVLLLLATTIGIMSVLSPVLVQAHSPPRANSYYEVNANSNNNAPSSLLNTVGRFGRFPFTRYFGRRLGNSNKATQSYEVQSDGLSMTDPYYQYDYRREYPQSSKPQEPLPIPTCKELRMMWLANHFRRYQNVYSENQQSDWNWVTRIPEVRQLIENLIQQSPNKFGATKDKSDEVVWHDKALDKSTFGTVKLLPDSNSKNLIETNKVTQEPPVYIRKITPSNDCPDCATDTKESLTLNRFGIIHIGPNDNAAVEQDKDFSSSVQWSAPKNQTKNNVSEQNHLIKAHQIVEQDGNRTVFGKFLEPSPKSTNRKSVKVEPTKGLNSGYIQSRSYYSGIPGVWHNKPIIPSVRII